MALGAGFNLPESLSFISHLHICGVRIKDTGMYRALDVVEAQLEQVIFFYPVLCGKGYSDCWERKRMA